MTDFLFLERLNNAVKQIPMPRLMHKKGLGAKGFFKPYMSFGDYTRAEIFQSPEEAFPVSVRFSSMLGEKGTADTVRNIKGLSVKFHADEGDYDLICQSLPVYPINSGEKFFEMMEAFSKFQPFDGINSEKLWSFAVKNPEALNCIIRLFSCRGLVDSYTEIDWYSVNTYLWENRSGKRFLVRYRWTPVKDEAEEEGCDKARAMDRIFAEFTAGFDPDVSGDRLRRQVEERNFPAFELSVQIADYKFISHPHYLKRTICWNDNIHSPVKAGLLKLTDMAEGGDESCDSCCFAPGNTISGIELCEDEFSGVMDYAHKIGGAERGVYL